jgi:hypothetical protein
MKDDDELVGIGSWNPWEMGLHIYAGAFGMIF